MNKLILIAIALVLVGCGKSEAEKARFDAEMKEIRYNQMSKDFVLGVLKDPSSAEFRNQKGFCGEVNSKNSFGAYTGFTKYVAADKNLVVFEENLKPHEFKVVWEKMCT